MWPLKAKIGPGEIQQFNVPASSSSGIAAVGLFVFENYFDIINEQEAKTYVILVVLYLILGNICCHKSIRSGRILNLDEMNALLREMEVTPNSGQCNHGRPTSIALSVKQIEKLFERI